MSESKNLPKPHRLVMVKAGFCDMCDKMCLRCGESGIYSKYVNKAHLIGWTCCKCEPCQTKFKQCEPTFIYSEQDFYKDFPFGFKVKRTSGAIENDWIYRSGLRTDSGIEITIDNGKDEKIVSLELLKSWQ